MSLYLSSDFLSLSKFACSSDVFSSELQLSFLLFIPRREQASIFSGKIQRAGTYCYILYLSECSILLLAHNDIFSCFFSQKSVCNQTIIGILQGFTDPLLKTLAFRRIDLTDFNALLRVFQRNLKEIQFKELRTNCILHIIALSRNSSLIMILLSEHTGESY